MSCPCCGGARLELAFRYTKPPEGETTFDLGGAAYTREYRRCPTCGHYLQVTDLDLTRLYTGNYVEATYGSDRLDRTYESIMALPPELSDNAQRVDRVVAHAGTSGTMLDVGSGLGVFPARLKAVGWTCTALDPDSRACAHLRKRVGVEAVQADFFAADALGRFDLVAFNKVLEHVADPVAMLTRARGLMTPGAKVYVEVPDAEGAAAAPAGPGREEFFIEHQHGFSMASLCLLALRAGFAVTRAERLREPSSKYTLYAFLSPEGTP